MSKQASRKAPPKRRPQQRKGRTATAAAAKGGKGNNRMTWIIVAVVLAVGGALVFALASSSNKKTVSNQADAPAPKVLVSKVTGVTDDVINAVGAGKTTGLPIRVKDKTAVLTSDGKPRIVYVGAEYCPFCATERWAMVNALSRFGKFSGLKTTTSGAPPEEFPNTATFSFYGSKFNSDYIKFEPVEQQTNKGQPLETPTSEQEALLTKYDVAPYTSRAGAIPFIDFANQFIVSGASYDAGVLSGLTHDQIAAALSDSSSNISQGAIGTANGMTAAICELTKNKPANVCSQPAIKDLQTQL